MHAGTLGAVIVYFWRDIMAALRSRRMIMFVLIVTAITGAIGVIGKDFLKSCFLSVRVVGISWL